jgi:hypothetical protein
MHVARPRARPEEVPPVAGHVEEHGNLTADAPAN